MTVPLCGDPVGIRTLDLLIRSQSLYPAELPSHVGMKANLHSIFSGRGRRNRTLNQWFWRPLLYQLSYTPTKISGFLSSQGASPQVLSAFAGLTAVFGMGTGGSPQLSPLNCYIVQDSYPDNCIKMFFLTNSLLVSESSFSLCICFQFHSFLRFGVSDSLSFARRLRLLQNWFSA